MCVPGFKWTTDCTGIRIYQFRSCCDCCIKINYSDYTSKSSHAHIHRVEYSIGLVLLLRNAIVICDEWFDNNLKIGHPNTTKSWNKSPKRRPPKTAMAIESNESSPEGRQRRSRILYAVTGSVAAVKGPEIAVRLVNELNFDVRILLTRGGENFWSKAKDYNLQYWNMLQELLVSNRETNTNDSQISMCCE